MKTLYELSAEYAALETLIAEQPAELDAEFALELDRLFAALADDEALATELDRVLGSGWAYVEQCFRPALRIGFANKFP